MSGVRDMTIVSKMTRDSFETKYLYLVLIFLFPDVSRSDPFFESHETLLAGHLTDQVRKMEAQKQRSSQDLEHPFVIASVLRTERQKTRRDRRGLRGHCG